MSQDQKTEANIVSLKRYRNTMQHSALSTVEAYWQGLRAGRVVPSRSEVDPRGIDKSLEFAFILERIAPGMARFRLAGMHLNDLMGMEVRGMPLTSFFVPDARRQISDALEHVFEEPAIARFRLVAEAGIGKPENEASLLILPLKSDLGDISRALGVLVYEGDIGRTPRRFTVSHMEVEPLVTPIAGTTRPEIPAAVREMEEIGATDSTSGNDAPEGFAEPKALFERPVREPRIEPKQPETADEIEGNQLKATGVPWLKVVQTED
ncbi:MAG: PAS domain-containing protein [Mangrovicoccus sp.]